MTLRSVILSLILITSVGSWASDSHDEGEDGGFEFIELVVRDFVLAPIDVERTETLFKQDLDAIKNDIMMQAVTQLLSDPFLNPQEQYYYFVAQAKSNCGDRIKSSQLISTATMIAIMYSKITIDNEIEHGIMMKAAHNYLVHIPVKF